MYDLIQNVSIIILTVLGGILTIYIRRLDNCLKQFEEKFGVHEHVINEGKEYFMLLVDKLGYKFKHVPNKKEHWKLIKK